MHRRTTLGLHAMVAATALVLSACGSGATDIGGNQIAPSGAAGDDTSREQAGHDDVAGTDDGADAGDGAAELDGALTIGAVVPLTGNSATIGMDQQRGIELALERINSSGGVLGRELRVQIEDDEGRAESGIQAAQKLVNVDGVPAVIGSYSSGISIPMQQYLSEHGIVGMNPGSSSGQMSGTGSLQFSTIGLDDVAGGFVADTVMKEGFGSIGLLAPNNAYGTGITNSVAEAFEELGGEVTTAILYNEGQRDYRQELDRLRSSDPELYVVTMYGEDGVIVNRQMYELGLGEDRSVFHIYVSMDVSDADPSTVEGHWGMDPMIQGKESDAYARAYEEAYGEPFITAYNGFAFDATTMIAAAINTAGSTEPEDIEEALWEISRAGYEGVTGPIEFDENGQRSEQAYMIADVRDGQLAPR